jgi:hypothetical protein
MFADEVQQSELTKAGPCAVACKHPKAVGKLSLLEPIQLYMLKTWLRLFILHSNCVVSLQLLDRCYLDFSFVFV